MCENHLLKNYSVPCPFRICEVANPAFDPSCVIAEHPEERLGRVAATKRFAIPGARLDLCHGGERVRYSGLR